MAWTDKTTTADKITAIKTDIAALEDSIANSGNKDVMNYTVNGRSLSRYTLTEKIQLHKFLNSKLRTLTRQLAIESGDGDPGKYKPRF